MDCEPVDDRERGSASVLTVTGIGMLAVMAVLGLGGRALVERRAVEDSLAQTRAYWAAMGQATYVLGRIRATGAGDKPEDTAKKYLLEIADGAKSKDRAATWRYPDVSAAYAIVVNADAKKAGAGQNGTVVMTFDFDTLDAGAPDALRTMPTLRKLEFTYCISATYAGACDNTPDKNNVGYNRLISIHRPS